MPKYIILTSKSSKMPSISVEGLFGFKICADLLILRTGLSLSTITIISTIT